MKSAHIRAAYLGFFAARGHTIVPSSSLIPANDATLLFANSGMVQFKDALSGREHPGFTRATSAQRCVRAGGKHNDLDNVGYTARHHTFFEMLGNFSFGDYFKVETITWAWEFLTDVLQLDPARLWVTVHEQDQESENIWIDRIGFPKSRITRLGDASNFWTMGDTGPCGPNTEIFFDHGADVAGGPPGTPGEDGDRFVEIWNLVFPQFDLQSDGRRLPLAQPGVDTGMGLERVAAALQGVHSNYETDLFRGVITAVAKIAGIHNEHVLANPSVRVIAEHIRATAFLMVDGVVPGNEDRSYVLRRIMRRALRHGHKLGIDEPFFHRLVQPLSEEMGAAYPELPAAQPRIEQIIRGEEERFAETLAQGMEVLDREVRKLKASRIPGDIVFRLYDTYGFPADLTADIARERGLTVDMAGFDVAMAAQKQRGRAASRFSVATEALPQIPGETAFVGYERLSDDAKVTALLRQNDGALAPVTALSRGEFGVVVLDRTPFYAEAGGQVGDGGLLRVGDGNFVVTETRPSSNQHLHFGVLEAGELRVGQTIEAKVHVGQRTAIALNHSATHLLHAALRKVLGKHVEQKGSLVTAERLRFDFAHFQAMTADELREVETLVNAQVRRNTTVGTEVLDFDTAVARGAMALFGEKYDNRVRVLTMGEGFSVELCGGTHVSRTGDIGVFRITSESGISAGVRRIEAVTGQSVIDLLDAADETLEQITTIVRTSPEEVIRKVQQLVEQNRTLSRELEEIKGQIAANRGVDLADQAHDVSGVKVLAVDMGKVDSKTLLTMLDALKSKLERAVILLSCVEDGKVSLIGGVTKNLTHQFKAGDLVREIGEYVGARGGGRPDMARAGGGDRLDDVPAALAKVTEWVAARL